MNRFFQPYILALGLLTPFAIPVAAEILSSTSPSIRNNLCVGASCVAEEVFNGDFNQVVVKASNTRILFDDATTIENFASDHWALQANERVSGGRNQFMLKNETLDTIPVTVQAGAGTNALFLATGGDVGLGTSIPLAKVHLVDTGTETAIRMTKSGGSAHSWELTAADTFEIRDLTDNSSRLYINTDGFVGFGTDTPGELLHIRSNATNTDAFALFDANGAGSDAAFRLRQNGVTPTTWEFRNQQDSGRLNVGLAGGNTPFKIDNAANNNLMRLGRNGLPGEVNITGTLVVNNTQLNVPDYVFDADYPLRPLAEVQAFIDENSHLPEVPSQAEIRANGVDMTEMQMTLLKKVEELTLYTLEQDAMIAALHEKAAQSDAQAQLITSLQLRLEALEATR